MMPSMMEVIIHELPTGYLYVSREMEMPLDSEISSNCNNCGNRQAISTGGTTYSLCNADCSFGTHIFKAFTNMYPKTRPISIDDVKIVLF